MNGDVGRHMTETAVIDRIVFREVAADRWPDFERLFECRGGPKACWCMVWRATPEEAKHTDGVSRKAAIAERITAGTTLMKNLLRGALWHHDQPTVGSLMMAALTKAFGQSLASSLFAGCAAKALLNESLPQPSTLPSPEVRRLWRLIQSIQSLRAIDSWVSFPHSKPQDFARWGALALGGMSFN